MKPFLVGVFSPITVLHVWPCLSHSNINLQPLFNFFQPKSYKYGRSDGNFPFSLVDKTKVLAAFACLQFKKEESFRAKAEDLRKDRKHIRVCSNQGMNEEPPLLERSGKLGWWLDLLYLSSHEVFKSNSNRKSPSKCFYCVHACIGCPHLSVS